MPRYITSVCAFILGVASGAAQSQTSPAEGGPAELPPPSYEGQQYVDSRGCVFVRAGIGGQVTWVPRVQRDRQPVCGRQPTFADTASGTVVVVETDEQAGPDGGRPAAATEPDSAGRVIAAPAPRPAPVDLPEGTTTSVATTATPEREVVRPAPEPEIERIPPRHVPAATARKVETRAAPRPVRRTVRPVAAAPRPRTVVASPRAGTIRATATPRYAPGTVFTKSELPDGVRVVPRHVYERNRAARVQGPAPEGYRPAFDDGRLNPRRAEMTREGIRQTELIWTNTVPRRLIERATGRDVTDQYVAVSTRGKTGAPAKVVRKKATGTPKATVSTRSTPRAAPSRHRYVQVGTFGEQANAARAAQRLKAAGLPVRYGHYRNDGRGLRVVLTGPFADERSLSNALAIARRAGFGDAFTRK